MVPGAPSFAPLAAPGDGWSSVPLYLHLLHMMPGADASIAAVRAAVRRSPDPDAEIAALLRAFDWRPHLPAAVAVALGAGGPAALRTLWGAFDRSWVTPQLAAAASLADPEFEEAAHAYLVDPPGLDVPAARPEVGKRIAALAFLCRGRSAAAGWLEEVLARPAVREALAVDAREHRGGAIAEAWLAGLRELGGAPGALGT